MCLIHSNAYAYTYRQSLCASVNNPGGGASITDKVTQPVTTPFVNVPLSSSIHASGCVLMEDTERTAERSVGAHAIPGMFTVSLGPAMSGSVCCQHHSDAINCHQLYAIRFLATTTQHRRHAISQLHSRSIQIAQSFDATSFGPCSQIGRTRSR